MAQGMTTRKHESMTRARTETVMREYLLALIGSGPFAEYFADDIVVKFCDLNLEISGREPARQTIADFHQAAFSSVPEVDSFVAGAGIACAELTFTGTHTGEFFGIAPTGLGVRVPYAAVWELADDLITAIRLYGPASGLIEQLTARPRRPFSAVKEESSPDAAR